jgi:hypothetical protein
VRHLPAAAGPLARLGHLREQLPALRGSGLGALPIHDGRAACGARPCVGAVGAVCRKAAPGPPLARLRARLDGGDRVAREGRVHPVRDGTLKRLRPPARAGDLAESRRVGMPQPCSALARISKELATNYKS